MNEFEIIEHYFKQVFSDKDGDVVLGIGDDAAIIHVPEDAELLISTDTLVSGVHFPIETSPEDIAYKSLAVNLSDMAAMGAEPKWVTLSLTVPENNDAWFKAFSKSFNQLAAEHSLVLIGGDLTKGPLSITVQIQGLTPKTTFKSGSALRRQGAQAGDLIYVTGKLGGAAFALQSMLNKTGKYKNPDKEDLLRLNRPQPRIKTGIALRGLATSCIDISDGLYADLVHILKASKVGAEIELDKIPYANSLLNIDKDLAIELALTGGDDYELCFTLSEDTKTVVLEHLNSICPISCIGKINDKDAALVCKKENGEVYQPESHAYRHFD